MISIRGARTHNLKNIDIDIPRNKLVVITGLSGSGKSSLAFDTIYAEGQRRYVESLSAYARQFLSVMEKPDVDSIAGLSPAISIEQKSTSHNPRSTVGTITEIHDYLRLLFARVGIPRCPKHGIELNAQTISQMVDSIMELPKEQKLMILAPVLRGQKGEQEKLITSLKSQGFLRVSLNGELFELDELPKLDPKKKNNLSVVVDRFSLKAGIENRLAQSLETALDLSGGLAELKSLSGESLNLFSAKYSCPECGWALEELEPRIFSFNNPHGACPDCDGLGYHSFIDPEKVLNFEKSIAEGAIRNWDKNTPFFYPHISAIAEHYGFSLDIPFKKLSKNFQEIILNGSGEEKIKQPILDYFCNLKGYELKTWEGVITNMQRRYLETKQEETREELAKFLAHKSCQSCAASRLNEAARSVFIIDKNLPAVNELSIFEAWQWAKNLKLSGMRGEIAEKIIKEIEQRLGFLVDVGLDYLTLARSADTLSGGEAQRIRLASQIGAGLMGIMYVLDEPSIGLHQRDNARLLKSLKNLRDLGNTVIVVEHDEEAINSADFVIDIGEGAGIYGGKIVASGTPEEIKNNPKSLTGKFLAGIEKIKIPPERKKFNPAKVLKITGARGNNLKAVNLEIPVGLFTCITGVSGSGKSTLINETLYRAVAKGLNRAEESPQPFDKISGLENFESVINIDQAAIGRTPRSNPATYVDLWGYVRDLFSKTEEARARNYKQGRFSLNVKGGRCEACKGHGVIQVAMHFLPNIYVNCDVCKGQRFNRETLEILYKGKNISEVLDMSVIEAMDFFQNIAPIKRKLQTLIDVGLSYIKLGQNSLTLSGGEAQRIKLSKELSKKSSGKTLYVLDEPTTGLHFQDISQLLAILQRLKENGNTVVVIEHNLDVIKTADWVVDLGPEGGSKGGEIIAVGSPEDLAKIKKSWTGQYLKLAMSS